MSIFKRLSAEFLGTFWLVFGGCGSAVLAAKFTDGLGIGFLGIALAFGLTVVTMVYAFGHISGGHFNPTISLGMFAGGRFEGHDVIPYMVVQVLGGIAAAALLYWIASGKPGFNIADGLANNGYGAHSPGGYALSSCLVAELLMSFMFVMIILGVSDSRAPAGFAPLTIGLALTLIHLITIPITNTSVNPARSTGPALMVGGWALQQLWLFWLAPLLGGLAAGIVYRLFKFERNN